jgi:oligopeptide transport system ATP-binding protein
MDSLLQVKNLSVSFRTYAGEVQAVRNVSFDLRKDEIIAVVGESGSGKSVMTQSLVKLLPSPPAYIKSGSVRYGSQELTKMSFRQLREIKGKEIAYIFQDPMTSLHPTLKIGRQVMEGILAHTRKAGKNARAEALALLQDVGIPDPARRMEQYPHELSGGMRQRVMIALAIAMKPKILVADEPTTALDVTIQAQILEVLKDINRRTGMSLILITHDMGIVANIARRVIVMYGGKIVESGSVLDIFERSLHPYTRCLLAAVPRLDMNNEKPLEYIVGSPPDMLAPPAGCPFAPRCRFSMVICGRQMPDRVQAEEGHEVYCHLQNAGAENQRRLFYNHYAGMAGEARA